MSQNVIVKALQSACQSQGEGCIVRGRDVIGKLIVTHGIEAIEAAAYGNLPLYDDWEYRRLAEIFEIHHQQALRRLVAFGQSSQNSEIAGAADDFDPTPKRRQTAAEPGATYNPGDAQ